MNKTKALSPASWRDYRSSVIMANLGRNGLRMGAEDLKLGGEPARFARAVDAIYDAAPDPSSWPQALQAIADVFGDVGAVLLYRRDDGSVGTISSPSLDAANEAYRCSWSQHDIRNARGMERGMLIQRDAITDRDIVTPEEIASHPIYTDFLVPFGLGWFASITISPDPRILVWISLQRAMIKPAFTDGELATLRQLGLCAEKALRLSIRLLDAELVNLELGDALGRIGIGVFALDALGRVVFVNPKGEALLGDGLRLDGDRLRIGPTRQPQDRTALDSALTQGQPAPAELPPILIERRATDRPLVLYILPVGSRADPAQAFLTHTRVILLVLDPQPGEPADPAVVRDLLGLTLAEARMASLVGSGLRPRDAAERLGISEETARTVLKRVFSKAGVSRQSELTALLARLVLQ